MQNVRGSTRLTTYSISPLLFLIHLMEFYYLQSVGIFKSNNKVQACAVSVILDILCLFLDSHYLFN